MIHSTVSAPKGEKTKYRLAESMKECMKSTPVEEITVRQICEICGVTRQTFYRNFLDKYDLINWYFDKLLTKSFEHMGRGTTVFDSLEKKFTYIQKEKAFFAAAFRYDKQNSLREHDFDLILAFYENLIHEKSGSPVSPEMHFLLEMYCQGSITMTVKWVLTGMDLTPSEFAALLVRAMPEDLKKLFRNLQLLSESACQSGACRLRKWFFRHSLVIFHKFCSVVFVTMAIFFKVLHFASSVTFFFPSGFVNIITSSVKPFIHFRREFFNHGKSY